MFSVDFFGFDLVFSIFGCKNTPGTVASCAVATAVISSGFFFFKYYKLKVVFNCPVFDFFLQYIPGNKESSDIN